MEEKEREPALEEKKDQTDHFFEEFFVPPPKDEKHKEPVSFPKEPLKQGREPLKQEVEWRDVVLSKKAWVAIVILLFLFHYCQFCLSELRR